MLQKHRCKIGQTTKITAQLGAFNSTVLHVFSCEYLVHDMICFHVCFVSFLVLVLLQAVPVHHFKRSQKIHGNPGNPPRNEAGLLLGIMTKPTIILFFRGLAPRGGWGYPLNSPMTWGLSCLTRCTDFHVGITIQGSPFSRVGGRNLAVFASKEGVSLVVEISLFTTV